MRPVQIADIEITMRALLQTPSEQRYQHMQDICKRADTADRYRKRFGRLHPVDGNGTLMAAALAGAVAPRPRALTSEALGCLHIVLTALLNQFPDDPA